MNFEIVFINFCALSTAKGMTVNMKQIKNMLLGISIILVTILIHLSIETLLITDFIVIIGFIFVLIGYSLENNNKSNNK